MATNPVIVIPSYWADRAEKAAPEPGAYDHSTRLDASAPELDRCLSSLEQVHDICRIIILAVCPKSATADTALRIGAIVEQHPALDVVVLTNAEAARIADAVGRIAPNIPGEAISLRGYGAIRNMGLAAACILGHDAVIFLDDDEVVLGADFMDKALFGLGAETRQRLPILVKTGFFYDRAGSALANTDKVSITNRWWTKRIEFNRWMKHALAGTRISRSNTVCGGLMALHARAYMRVAFDPYITRGEDLDYLFNMRLFGYDVWFDNVWAVKHLPPAMIEIAPRFMQNVYRWYYERAKVAFASRQPDLSTVTPASLMPYPGPWISGQLDDRVRKTSLARALLTHEHAGYWHIWRHGRADAERYAREHVTSYLKFQSFWPSLMDALWKNAELKAVLEHA